MDNKNLLTIKPAIQKGFEGYAKTDEGIKFYGCVPIEKTCCITYNMKNPGTDKGASFSISFSNKDAIHIENVLKLEIGTRRPISEIYHSGDIYMTCLVGSHPVISHAEKRYSFSFAKNEDYDELLALLSEYLERQDTISKEEKKLRENLRKEREAYIENYRKKRKF